MRKAQVMAATAAVLVGGGGIIAATGGARPTAGGDAAARQETNSFTAAGGVTADAAAPPVDVAPRVPTAESRVVKTAQLDISMSSNDRVRSATARANRVAEANGGFVASTESSKDEGRQATLILRVPVANYEAALGELRRLGKVNGESLGGRDVTSTLVDLDARLRTLRAQEAALNALVAKARTVGETLEVAREAASVRMQIEQLAAQQAQLADQADFATITLRLVGPNAALAAEPRTQPLLVDALMRAGGGALAVLGGVIILLGYVVPSAALAAVGYGAWRLIGRRRPAVAS